MMYMMYLTGSYDIFAIFWHKCVLREIKRLRDEDVARMARVQAEKEAKRLKYASVVITRTRQTDVSVIFLPFLVPRERLAAKMPQNCECRIFRAAAEKKHAEKPWTHEETSVLAKAMNRFPGGTHQYVNY